MRFIFEQLRIGGDRNFGYLIGDREASVGVLVDPSYAPESLVERARAQGLKITHILNTHGHSDHTNGNAAARSLTDAKVAGVIREHARWLPKVNTPPVPGSAHRVLTKVDGQWLWEGQPIKPDVREE